MQPNDIIVLSDNQGHTDPITPLYGAATCYCPFNGRISGTQHRAQIFVEESYLPI